MRDEFLLEFMKTSGELSSISSITEVWFLGGWEGAWCSFRNKRGFHPRIGSDPHIVWRGAKG